MTFLTKAATMQSMSLAALEEASRDGLRDADLEHLLLAVVIGEHTAGRALRSMGITLDAAREAVREQHDEQLRRLGIEATPPRPDRIVLHENVGYDLTDRARRMAGHAGDRGRGDGSALVLRALIDEPSGLIVGILSRLGTSADEVRSALGVADEPATARGVQFSADVVSGRREVFIGAVTADVWALLSDTERMPEWQQSFATMTPEEGSDGVWIAQLTTEEPDGTPIRMKEGYAWRRIVRLHADEPSRIAWRLETPDAPGSVQNTLEMTLSPVTGGTLLTITSSWPRRKGWQRVRSLALRPVHRFVIWTTISYLGDAIGRVFR